MVEKLSQEQFFFFLNDAVQQFISSVNKDEYVGETSAREIDEAYKSLVGNTSRKAMEIAFGLELIPGWRRTSGSDNTITSTIELIAIVETWGPLTALQVMRLHSYVHAAYDHYLEMHAIAAKQSVR